MVRPGIPVLCVVPITEHGVTYTIISKLSIQDIDMLVLTVIIPRDGSRTSTDMLKMDTRKNRECVRQVGATVAKNFNLEFA